MEAIENPRSAPLTVAEMRAMDDEPTATDAFEACTHQGACVRALGLLLYGGEVNTDAFGWMDECAAALGCDECEEWE